MRYSKRCCSIRIGSAVCSNRLTTGAQPSRNVFCETPNSSVCRRSLRSKSREEEQELRPARRNPPPPAARSRRDPGRRISPGRRNTPAAAGSPRRCAAETAAGLRPAGSPPAGASRGRQHHRFLGRRGQIARHDLDAVVAQQLDQSRGPRCLRPAGRTAASSGRACEKRTSGRQSQFDADHGRRVRRLHRRLQPVGRPPIGGGSRRAATAWCRSTSGICTACRSPGAEYSSDPRGIGSPVMSLPCSGSRWNSHHRQPREWAADNTDRGSIAAIRQSRGNSSSILR